MSGFRAAIKKGVETLGCIHADDHSKCFLYFPNTQGFLNRFLSVVGIPPDAVGNASLLQLSQSLKSHGMVDFFQGAMNGPDKEWPFWGMVGDIQNFSVFEYCLDAIWNLGCDIGC